MPLKICSNIFIHLFLWLLLWTPGLKAQVDLICPIDRVNLENTKNCLEGRLNRSETFDEELVTQLARVLISMKQFDQIPSLLKKFPKLTLNYVEIRILLAWSQKKYSQVISFYQYYQKKGLKVEEIERSQYPLVMSLWETDQKVKAKEQHAKALEKFPNNKQLKMLELTENYHRMVFDYLMYSESDNRTLAMSNFEYIYRSDNIVLQPGYEFYARDYVTEKLTDANFKLMTKFQTSYNKWLNFGIQHSLSNVFIARNTYIIQRELKIKHHQLIFDSTFKDFRRYNAWVFKVKDELSIKSWNFFGSFQILSNDYNKQVFGAGVSFDNSFIIPALWVSAGKADPTLPYLTRDLDENFQLYGFKLSKVLFKVWKAEAFIEKRSEKDYSYNMTGFNFSGTF